MTTWLLIFYLAAPISQNSHTIARFTSKEACERQAAIIWRDLRDYYAWHICQPEDHPFSGQPQELTPEERSKFEAWYERDRPNG